MLNPQEVLSLSSGTISVLAGTSPNYEEIDKIQFAFYSWIIEQKREFENWVEAWNEFTKEEELMMQSITHLMSCEGTYNFSHGTVEIGKNESFVAINTNENSYFLQGDEATRFIEDVKNAWENVFRNWLFPQVLERFIEDY